jgi:hypothetical protein
MKGVKGPLSAESTTESFYVTVYFCVDDRPSSDVSTCAHLQRKKNKERIEIEK